ncbi:trifunctional transcriptional regulator/proline dehydrogenase/pyrroline-5-carboxylate dehydrogenase [Citrobacter koseri]|uniref:Trifunctional transcriptional regulator/proline dehydrogenase/pyrroline-5-carboxylate dehydrogenase n=1 Tax=Citrobacter koseri TaxID=545 RepID=A0A3S4MBH2_CITKO|nr:trifunctional transcriptional regulator/proline dehydrogenase/pyrroline-5-carboxylate dehydrogenase [Citrobacter koseri]
MLHVVRYTRNHLPELIAQINASGYGLTLGVHTRIDETIAQVTGSAHAGNLYVNRNMVGAVVGVQPFAAKACPAPGRKRAVRSISTVCWQIARKTRWALRLPVRMRTTRWMPSLKPR